MRRRRFWVVLLVASITLLVAGCADIKAVERAADSYPAPDDFVLIEGETLNGFETVTRQFTYSTDLTGPDACEAGRRSLEEWAGATPELEDRESPGSFCRYELRSVPNFPDVDFAAVRVKRSIAGTSDPGQVTRVVVFFSIDK